MYGELTSFTTPLHAARGAAETESDEGCPTDADSANVTRYAYDEVKPYGAEHFRQACLRAGDVALILHSRKGTAAAVPFQQTVVLRSRLLDRPP